MDAAMDCHARVVDAISQFEPVTLVANPGAGDVARRSCPEANVELIELPIDDSWFRDSGPIIVKDESGDRLGVDFRFNSWGQKFTPYDRDAAIIANCDQRSIVALKNYRIVRTVLNNNAYFGLA
jgi:agmatine deiminase